MENGLHKISGIKGIKVYDFPDAKVTKIYFNSDETYLNISNKKMRVACS